MGQLSKLARKLPILMALQVYGLLGLQALRLWRFMAHVLAFLIHPLPSANCFAVLNASEGIEYMG